MKHLIPICLILSCCSKQTDGPATWPEPTPEAKRFSSQYIRHADVYVIHDCQTGKEYLGKPSGGFIEIEPTKKP